MEYATNYVNGVKAGKSPSQAFADAGLRSTYSSSEFQRYDGVSLAVPMLLRDPMSISRSGPYIDYLLKVLDTSMGDVMRTSNFFEAAFATGDQSKIEYIKRKFPMVYDGAFRGACETGSLAKIKDAFHFVEFNVKLSEFQTALNMLIDSGQFVLAEEVEKMLGRRHPNLYLAVQTGKAENLKAALRMGGNQYYDVLNWIDSLDPDLENPEYREMVEAMFDGYLPEIAMSWKTLRFGLVLGRRIILHYMVVHMKHEIKLKLREIMPDVKNGIVFGTRNNVAALYIATALDECETVEKLRRTLTPEEIKTYESEPWGEKERKCINKYFADRLGNTPNEVNRRISEFM